MGLRVYDYLNTLTIEELCEFMVVSVAVLTLVWIVIVIWDFIKRILKERKYHD